MQTAPLIGSGIFSAGGMAMFFLLGLRHGVEPDHMAAIDGMTLRAHDRRERHAPWVGTLFAAGHGLAVGMIAVVVALLASSLAVPPLLAEILQWLPILLLAALGAWNLKVLLAPGPYRPDSVRMKLMPQMLRERTDAWSTFAVGLLFALVVDTVAHVSAWSVFATQAGGWWAGVAAGLLFSCGMLVASTLDSQLISTVLRRSASAAATSRVRRAIGWMVVLLSFGLVLQATIMKLSQA
jgi:nickel/cobalt transporter (NiCoT) family protein